MRPGGRESRFAAPPGLSFISDRSVLLVVMTEGCLLVGALLAPEMSGRDWGSESNLTLRHQVGCRSKAGQGAGGSLAWRRPLAGWGVLDVNLLERECGLGSRLSVAVAPCLLEGLNKHDLYPGKGLLMIVLEGNGGGSGPYGLVGVHGLAFLAFHPRSCPVGSPPGRGGTLALVTTP